MGTKTFTTKSGKIVKVDFERKVQDKVVNADGDRIVVGREIVERTGIVLSEQNGKVIARGYGLSMLHPGVPTNKKMIEKGAVARIGDVYISQEVADQIKAALAELDAENPKSDEQLAMEQAKAAAHARWEAEAPMRHEREEFERKMNRADSDY